MSIGKSIAKAATKNGVAFTALSAGYEYFNSKARGDTTLHAAGSAAATAAVTHVLPWQATALIHAAPFAKDIGSSLIIGTQQKTRDMARSNVAFSNAYFSDNEQRFTMRQAGMAQIEQAEYDQQNAMLGREAKYMNY